MIRAALRGIWEHKLRTALLAMAVVAGVSFVAGSLIFTDTIGGSFDSLFDSAFEGVDVQIAPDVELGFANLQPTFDATVLDVVNQTPGIKDVWPVVAGVINVRTDPPAPAVPGPPTVGIAWEGDPSFSLVEGRAPAGPQEVAIDLKARDKFGLAIGGQVEVASTGALASYTVVGFVDSLPAGPEFFLFDLPTATTLLNLDGLLTNISLTVDDPANVQTVIDDLRRRLPSGVTAIDGQEAAEQQAAVLKEALGFFQTFLLVFAAIALVVGAFVVYNAFRTVLGQRTRELGLFRVLGATRRQVILSVLAEAAAIGMIAGLVGLVGGIGLAAAAQFGFSFFGGSGLAENGLVFEPSTFLAAFGLGMAVTTVSALLPALRASRISPLAALVTIDRPPRRLTPQIIIGSLIGIPGIVLVVLTGLDRASLTAGGIGALAVIFGGYVFGAVIAKPSVRSVAKIVGTSPVRKIATDNAARSPRRTGATAGALMFGVTLVVAVSVLVFVVQDTATAVLEDAVAADLIIQSAGPDPTAGVSPDIADIIAGIDLVASTQSVRFNEGQLNGEDTFFGSAEPETIEATFNFDTVEGDWSDLVGTTVAVQRKQADELGLSLGDTVNVDIGAGPEPWEVVVIWKYASDVSDNQGFYLPTRTLAERFPQANAIAIYVNVAPGSDPAMAQAAIVDAIGDDYPFVEVVTQEELLGDLQTQLLGLLSVVFVLLAMSIFIALLGIVLILLLSVFERTRELGLLRAVGATRQQTRSMIRWEAVFVSILGAIMGALLGTFLGWGLAGGIFGAGFNFAVPWTWIGIGLIAAIVAGVLAAILPARRAANLNILEAIAYE